jgi:uncharacterized membrane protein
MADEPVPPGESKDESSRKVMLVLAYLGVLALVPYLLEKNDREVQWHAKNGLLLFGAWVAVFMVDIFLFSMIRIFGCLLSIFLPMIGLLYLVLVVLGIMKALSGERLLVPGISSLADKF